MKPARLWRPWLGHWFSVSPSDIADMTPGQLMSCLEVMNKSK